MKKATKRKINRHLKNKIETIKKGITYYQTLENKKKD